MPGAAPKVVVVGGGVAGLSMAAELAPEFDVLLIEAERNLSHHSTSRSAAVYIEPYLHDAIWALTRYGRATLEALGLLHPRGNIRVAPTQEAIDDYLSRWASQCPYMHPISMDDVAARLGGAELPGYRAAAFNPEVFDIDVHGLTEHYRKRALASGAEVATGAVLREGDHSGSAWRLRLDKGDTLQADMLVNAAGAWGDVVAARCGIDGVGLQPRQRTMVQVPYWSEGQGEWPMVHDLHDRWYLKPESGEVLLSPTDQVPTEPQDARPDELAIATAVHRVEEAFEVSIPRLTTSWAGLRTFSPDEVPVLGPDSGNPAFVWCVGQGGYGIQAAPGIAACTKALLLEGELPDEAHRLGLEAAGLRSDRFR